MWLRYRYAGQQDNETTSGRWQELWNYGIMELWNYGIMELRRASLVLRQTTRLLVNKTTSVASLVLRRQRTTELGLRQVSTDDYVDM